MNLDEARKIVAEGLPQVIASNCCKTIPHSTYHVIFYRAQGIVEGHALGQAKERERCAMISRHHAMGPMNGMPGSLEADLIQHEILKGEADANR